MKINVNGYELEFEKELVEMFENTVFASFPQLARLYLKLHFHTKDLSEIFANHTEQKIKDVIIEFAKSEIALYKGEL